MTDSRLKDALDRLAGEYDARFIDTDPVGIVRRYVAPADIEVAGLAVSGLGYGGANLIRRNAENMLGRIGGSPADFAVNASVKEAFGRFRGFRHRWTEGADIALLFLAVGGMIREYGSVGDFVRSADDPGDETVETAMTRLAGWLCTRCGELAGEAGIAPRDPFIVPSPADGSACKRPAMYFRWMVRGPDAVDFGLWGFLSPSRLVIPVDRHMARMAARLGLTSRRNADWRMALDITRALRGFDSDDPLRYDFALVRPGITRSCVPGTPGLRKNCALGAVCGEDACV